MTFQAENFADHYKAVKARLWSLPQKRVFAQAVTRYPAPIFPKRPVVSELRKQSKLRKDAPPLVESEEDLALAWSIVREVAAEHGVTPADIIGRRRRYAQPRHAAIGAVAVGLPHWSLPRIGRFFDYRDHTTVLNSLGQCGLYGRQAIPSPESFVEGLGCP